MEKSGLANNCNAGIVIQHDLKQIINRRIKTKILTDSKTIFNIILRNASNTEIRLMIDVKAAIEAYIEKLLMTSSRSEKHPTWAMQ